MTIPTWTIVVPLLAVYFTAWVYFGGKAWDRWVTPRWRARYVRHAARKYDMTEADVRRTLDRRL